MSALGNIYSLVIPVFNEQESLGELYKRLSALFDTLDGQCEVIFVDDGSKDMSVPMILNFQAKDQRIKLVQLSRNFGHQVAVTAGLDFATGDAVVVLDADLQDPPELVAEMIAKWKQGYQVVYAIRTSRLGENRIMQAARQIFYRLIRRVSGLDLPLDAGDFRLMDKKVISTFKHIREHNRYIRGLSTWVGFNQTFLKYDRPARFAGESKYPFVKLVKLAFDGILSFSSAPLRASLWVGFGLSALSLLYGLEVLIDKIRRPGVITGWTSTMIVLTLLGAVQLVVMGVMGLYIGRIYDEVKNRPIYIVKNVFGAHDQQIERAVLFRDTKNPKP